MNRPGDWNCRSCNHLNFQRRESCQRCTEPRASSGGEYGISSFGGRSGGGSYGFITGPDVRPGDWYCSVANCGAHNFASRSSCFKCTAPKDHETDLPTNMRSVFGFAASAGSSTSRPATWKSGDWFCTRFLLYFFISSCHYYSCGSPK